MYTIRASMLPGYADCPRRAAAKQWRKEIIRSGFDLREILSSVGASIGTSVHAAMACYLNAKRDYFPDDMEDPQEVAIEKFREDVNRGVEWDETSPSHAVATKQIRRMAAMAIRWAGKIDPAMIEEEIYVALGDDFELSGHVDVITMSGQIFDLKTGALSRPYQQQLGAYSLLAKSPPCYHAIDEVGVCFIKRTPATKPQEAPTVEIYRQDVCEMAAESVIKACKRDFQDFLNRVADPNDDWPEEAFLANPNSMMCRPQFCPAHGTRFCHLGRL